MSRARRPTPLYVAAVPKFFGIPCRYPADVELPLDSAHSVNCSDDETVDLKVSGIRKSPLDASAAEPDASPGTISPVSKGEPGRADGPGLPPCGGAHG
jgi:hypothetical protein